MMNAKRVNTRFYENLTWIVVASTIEEPKVVATFHLILINSKPGSIVKLAKYQVSST